MVDVGEKSETHRIAIAESRVVFSPEVKQKLALSGWSTKKGPIIETAIVAGTLAVKNTSNLIPFCHNILIESIKINIEAKENSLSITCQVKTHGRTGVEMEALTGASIAALTIYDMCKSLDKAILIENTCLLHKSGGKSNYERSPSISN